MRLQRLPRPFLFCFLSTGILLAQQHTHVSGLIHDPSGAGVAGAAVSVVSQDTGFRRQTRSRSNGGYVVASLQPGIYKITVRKEGFRTLIHFGVKLGVAQPVQLDFTLPLGSVREVVTVTASSPLLNTEDASVGTVIGRDRIEKLPLNGRGLLSLLEFAPGTIVTPATRGEAGQFTTSGQRPNANYFSVDGVSANNGVSAGGLPARSTGGSLPAMTALGSLHGLISLEALDEFRVQTSTASPQFGRLPGAQVVLSSRSGSNEVRGSLFHYFRHGRLDANDWFANQNGTTTTPLRMSDFGATLGGPLKRNQLFLFLSYEGMRLRAPFAWRSPAPTLEARDSAPEWARPVLDLFPVPNGPQLGPKLAEWTGQNDRRSRLDVMSARLDHSVTSRLTIFGRYHRALSSNEFTSTRINDLDMKASSLTFGTNLRLSPRFVVDLKVNHSHASGRSFWRTTNPLGEPCLVAGVTMALFRTEGACNQMFRFSIAGVGQVASGREADQLQTQWHTLPTAMLVAGGHQVRFGVDHRRYAPQRRDHSASLSIIAENFSDLLAQHRLWVATAESQSARTTLSEYSLFGQDTWRIHPQLTATFGLRWEYSRAPELTQPDGSSNPSSAYALPGQTAIWQRNYRNFAPRAGIAYRPWKKGRTVLRAGWGLFYDSTLSIATDLVNAGPFSVSRFLAGKNAPFTTLLSFGFQPDLRLPAVYQWNVTLERGATDRDVVSVGYVGASGHHLLRREFGGFEGSQTLWLALATNHGESDYHGLQVQYRRPMTRGFQALASYSWSHSIDNSSSDSLLHRVGTDFGAWQDRGSSDFDVRHALILSLTYETEPRPGGSLGARLWRGWGIDGILRARSGFPITVLNSEYSMGLGFANAFRPDLVPGQSIWLRDRSTPGGRRLDRDAFHARSGSQGNLGRNAIRGFGMHQIDVAVRREFKLTQHKSFLFRFEAFNLLNHPNFADPAQFLSSTLFGESPSMLNLMLGTGSPGSGLTPVLQVGGARSLQFSWRFRF